MNSPLQQITDQRAYTLQDRTVAEQPSLSSTDILRGQKTVEINHNGATYKLQATRLGKLILTK
jgi:hemin uptake protein HemP